MIGHQGPSDRWVLPAQVWLGLAPQQRARVIELLATLATNLLGSRPDPNSTEVPHVHASESLQDPT